MDKFLAGVAVGLAVGIGGIYLASEIVERKIPRRIKIAFDDLRGQVARKIEPDQNY